MSSQREVAVKRRGHCVGSAVLTNYSTWSCANDLTVSKSPHPKNGTSVFYSPVVNILCSAEK